jgi:Putative prokaryotic signal transducing protein
MGLLSHVAAAGYRRVMADDMENTTMVAVFSSSNHDAEMEAITIKGVLDSSGIPAMVVGPHILPNLEFQVQVPEDRLREARDVIRDARQGGREAAAEAEAETEKG